LVWGVGLALTTMVVVLGPIFVHVDSSTVTKRNKSSLSHPSLGLFLYE